MECFWRHYDSEVRPTMSPPLEATPPIGSEQLYNALQTGAQEVVDLNAIRDGVVSYIRYQLQQGTPATQALLTVRRLVERFNGRHGTHFAALAEQIVSWTIHEHFKADGK